MAIEAHRYETNDPHLTFYVAPGESITANDAVKIVGEKQVAPTDTAGEEYYGIAHTSAEGNEEIGVARNGTHAANVANPDGSVGAGVRLVPSGNAGELRPINTGGATGEAESTLRPYVTITAEDANGEATLDLG